MYLELSPENGDMVRTFRFRDEVSGKPLIRPLEKADFMHAALRLGTQKPFCAERRPIKYIKEKPMKVFPKFPNFSSYQ